MSLIRKPFLVYLIISLLALWGVSSYKTLAVALFPPANQLAVNINVSYQTYSSKQFSETVGRDLETQLQAFQEDSVSVENIVADYGTNSASYHLNFGWGVDSKKILPVLENRLNSILSKYEINFREGASVSVARNDQGFFALSFFSATRSPEELFKILQPIVKPLNTAVLDANDVLLFNPDQKAIIIELIPQKLAQYQITVTQVYAVIKDALQSYNGGTIQSGEDSFEISIKSKVTGLEQFANLKVGAVDQSSVFLKEIANISLNRNQDAAIKFKTQNMESLILFATPKEGGNIKRMSDEILSYISKAHKDLPADIQFKVLVNPSEFIENSINSVVREVFLASFLAVLVLFFFIGGFRNVFTAAIEIPVSLVIAFGLMKLTNMNINLISLSGLALSAGMNVDASVVVLENIFRHFKNSGPLTNEEKFNRVLNAVNEVKVPIITSTLTSLLVFTPLVFTRGISNSLLGDLAKAVIFSHGISAFVALFLVPTIRLHLLSKGDHIEINSPIEAQLQKLERLYQKCLTKLLSQRKLQNTFFLSIITAILLIGALSFFTLKREIIGKPDSDWLIVSVQSNSDDSLFLEEKLTETENKIKDTFGEKILDTFSQQMGGTRAFVMAKIKNRSKMKRMIGEAEAVFKDSPQFTFAVESWSPTEFVLPDSNQFKMEIKGGDNELRAQVAKDIQTLLYENNVYDTIDLTPNASRKKSLELVFNPSQIQSEIISRSDIAQFLRTATMGMQVQNFQSDGQEIPISMKFPGGMANSAEKISSLPIGFEGRIIPIGSLVKFVQPKESGAYYKENGIAKSVISARLKADNVIKQKSSAREARVIVSDLMDRYRAKDPKKISALGISFPDPQKEITEAIGQLLLAFMWSGLLILVVLYLQFNSLKNALIGMISIPLGVLGTLLSLLVFQSTLSLNSCLGAILLNGIAVANSIILIDFIQRKQQANSSFAEIAEIASVRLRPILITSLTTILGMLPIALGLGEGGNTLQPLGISVSGGLFISTLLTMFCVPCLIVRFSEFRTNKPAGNL